MITRSAIARFVHFKGMLAGGPSPEHLATASRSVDRWLEIRPEKAGVAYRGELVASSKAPEKYSSANARELRTGEHVQ